VNEIRNVQNEFVLLFTHLFVYYMFYEPGNGLCSFKMSIYMLVACIQGWESLVFNQPFGHLVGCSVNSIFNFNSFIPFPFSLTLIY